MLDIWKGNVFVACVAAKSPGTVLPQLQAVTMVGLSDPGPLPHVTPHQTCSTSIHLAPSFVPNKCSCLFDSQTV